MKRRFETMQEAAERTAAEMQSGELDGWTYRAECVNGDWSVYSYDETGIVAGALDVFQRRTVEVDE